MPRTPPPLLGEDERAALASTLPGWELTAGGRGLSRRFEFASFPVAFAFVTRVALLAERLNHHPDIHLSFRRLTIELTTHDAGGLTALDVDMATRISRMADAGA
jgi:4a-hydroxytetrahydrobiopterin dehydratase